MTKFELLTLILALVSVILALGSLIMSIISWVKTNEFSKNALNKSEVQNMIAMGNLELSISERIANSREKVGEITMILSPFVAKKSSGSLSTEETSILESHITVLNSAIENNINAYEDACSKYLDEKVDIVRFKKLYNIEIRQLVENTSLQSYFNPLLSKYKAILKVYSEWNNLEK